MPFCQVGRGAAQNVNRAKGVCKKKSRRREGHRLSWVCDDLPQCAGECGAGGRGSNADDIPGLQGGHRLAVLGV